MGVILNLLSLLIYVTGIVWVTIDTKRIGVKKGLINGLGNMSRTGWIVATILIWIIAIPLYVFQRKKIIERSQALDASKTRPTFSYVMLSLWVLDLIFIILPIGISQYDKYQYTSKANDIVSTFKNDVDTGMAGMAAALAGQTTTMPSNKTLYGVKINSNHNVITPKTNGVIISMQPPQSKALGLHIALTLPSNNIHGCGDNGGCEAKISNTGVITYSHYSATDSKLAPMSPKDDKKTMIPPKNVENNDNTAISAVKNSHFSEGAVDKPVFHKYPENEELDSNSLIFGSPGSGRVMIGHNGEWLINMDNNEPLSTGYNFHSYLGYGKLELDGWVDYEGKHYNILRDIAGGGQVYVAKWIILWRKSDGHYAVTKFFGTGDTHVHVILHNTNFEIVMNGNNQTKSYTFRFE